MASTLKQRLRRFNGTDYDTIYVSPNVEDATGTLPVANGGTGRSTLTSGYFLRGNGTSAVTMDSVATVKSALGIGSSAHVAVATMSRKQSSGTTTYTASNLGFVVKAFFGYCIYSTSSSGYSYRNLNIVYYPGAYDGTTNRAILLQLTFQDVSSEESYFKVLRSDSLNVPTNTTTTFSVTKGRYDISVNVFDYPMAFFG